MNASEILSLGEGFSGLMPYLRSKGARAWGLDLWYSDDLKALPPDLDHRAEMIQYVDQYGSNLITGDATDFSTFRQNNQPIDMVVSHALFHYLSIEGKLGLLNDSFNAIREGGEIRIAYWGDEPVSDVRNLLSKMNADPNQMEYQVFQGRSSVSTDEVFSAMMIIVKKKKQ